jgi:hypothetical protein
MNAPNVELATMLDAVAGTWRPIDREFENAGSLPLRPAWTPSLPQGERSMLS